MGPKPLRVFAYVWICLAGGVIILSYCAIWYTDGFAKLQEMLSPFNLWNFAAVAITLSPGIGAYMLAERLQERSGSALRSNPTAARADMGVKPPAGPASDQDEAEDPVAQMASRIAARIFGVSVALTKSIVGDEKASPRESAEVLGECIALYADAALRAARQHLDNERFGSFSLMLFSSAGLVAAQMFAEEDHDEVGPEVMALLVERNDEYAALSQLIATSASLSGQSGTTLGAFVDRLPERWRRDFDDPFVFVKKCGRVVAEVVALHLEEAFGELSA